MPFVRRIFDEAKEADRPVLRKVAKKMDPAELADPLTQQLIDDMFLTMYNAPGIGLAAPQIGIGKRLVVIDLQDGDLDHGPLVLVNPKFTVTEGEFESTEGCLSVPGMIGELDRYERVAVSALDRHGNKIVCEGESSLFARCLQHEIDHLNGVLYIDKARNLRPADADDEDDDEIEPADAAAAGRGPVEQSA